MLMNADKFAKKNPTPKEHKSWAETASKALREGRDEGKAIKAANAAIARGSPRKPSQRGKGK